MSNERVQINSATIQEIERQSGAAAAAFTGTVSLMARVEAIGLSWLTITVSGLQQALLK